MLEDKLSSLSTLNKEYSIKIKLHEN